MSFEPTLFDSTMYETANEAVLFCQQFLEKNGYDQLAQQLRGSTPVNNVDAGHIVRNVLLEARAKVRGPAAEYVAIALSTVERALAERRTAVVLVA